jgi:outer membrane lipoprotein-sorting protein
VLLATAVQGADDLQAVYTKIDAGATGFKGLTADIRKVAHMDVINEDDASIGKMIVKQAKAHDLRFRFDFVDPATRQIVQQVSFAGTKLEIYYPKQNNIEEGDLRTRKTMVEQFMLLGFGSTSRDLQSAYQVRLIGQESVNKSPTWRIELTPKSPDMVQTFPKIELWISQATGMALQQKLYDKGGKDYHLATYTDMKLRSDIPNSDLELNPPKGVTRTKLPIK